MKSLAKQAVELDRMIHEPARLAVMALLYSAEEADFLFLLRESGLDEGQPAEPSCASRGGWLHRHREGLCWQDPAHGVQADAPRATGVQTLSKGAEEARRATRLKIQPSLGIELVRLRRRSGLRAATCFRRLAGMQAMIHFPSMTAVGTVNPPLTAPDIPGRSGSPDIPIWAFVEELIGVAARCSNSGALRRSCAPTCT